MENRSGATVRQEGSAGTLPERTAEAFAQLSAVSAQVDADARDDVSAALDHLAARATAFVGEHGRADGAAELEPERGGGAPRAPHRTCCRMAEAGGAT